MVMDLSYTIKFYSEWHCGSGLAAGADLDALVVKDSEGLPFVPGKTIKGLVKEAIEYISSFENTEDTSSDNNTKQDNKCIIGNMFFTNAELENSLRRSIIQKNLSKYLYRSLASTAIENGIAKEHSLRRIEVVVPCEVQGKILEVPDELKDIICKGLKYIKRLGQNRNRGLGRCDFIIK